MVTGTFVALTVNRVQLSLCSIRFQSGRLIVIILHKQCIHLFYFVWCVLIAIGRFLDSLQIRTGALRNKFYETKFSLYAQLERIHKKVDEVDVQKQCCEEIFI